MRMLVQSLASSRTMTGGGEQKGRMTSTDFSSNLTCSPEVRGVGNRDGRWVWNQYAPIGFPNRHRDANGELNIWLCVSKESVQMAKQGAHFIVEGGILQVSLGLIEQDLVPGTNTH